MFWSTRFLFIACLIVFASPIDVIYNEWRLRHYYRYYRNKSGTGSYISGRNHWAVTFLEILSKSFWNIVKCTIRVCVPYKAAEIIRSLQATTYYLSVSGTRKHVSFAHHRPELFKIDFVLCVLGLLFWQHLLC